MMRLVLVLVAVAAMLAWGPVLLRAVLS